MPRRISAEDKEKFICFITNELMPSNVKIGSLCQPRDKSPLKDYLFVKRLTQDGKEVRYDVLEAEPLGMGSFGAVYRILMTLCERDKQIVPIETSLNRVAKMHFYGGIAHKEKYLNELQILQEHGFIRKETKNAHVFDRRFKTQLYDRYAYSIMMEAKGLTIDEIIQQQIKNKNKVEFKIILPCVIAMLRELMYVHANNKVHNDLSSSNIFYDKKTLTATIIDFAFSKKAGKEMRSCGTLLYSAPEIASAALDKSTILVNPKTDIFAICGIVYELFGASGLSKVDSNRCEFFGNRKTKGYEDYLQGLFDYVIGIDDEGRASIKKYLSEMSALTPERRPTAAVAAKFFEDVLQKIDPDLYAKQQDNIKKQHLYRNEVLKMRMALQRVNKVVLAQITRLKKEVSCLESKGNSSKTEIEEIKNKLNCLTKIRDYINKTVMDINVDDYVYDELKPKLKYTWDFLNSLEVKKVLGANRSCWLPDFFSPISYRMCLNASNYLLDWEAITPANPIICGC